MRSIHYTTDHPYENSKGAFHLFSLSLGNASQRINQKHGRYCPFGFVRRIITYKKLGGTPAVVPVSRTSDSFSTHRSMIDGVGRGVSLLIDLPLPWHIAFFPL